jgi:hypothetical protein
MNAQGFTKSPLPLTGGLDACVQRWVRGALQVSRNATSERDLLTIALHSTTPLTQTLSPRWVERAFCTAR